MKMNWTAIGVAVALACLTAGPLRAQGYVGPGKCKVCHAKEELGDQYSKWQSTKHAKAFATLSTPEAKAAGAKVGVADPATSPKCLICHTTPGRPPAEGVSCEACHGPGEKWKAKEVHGTDRNKAIALGMVDTKAQGEAVCKKCHVPERDGNKNPSYKPFNYAEFHEKIKHPGPKK